MLHYRHNNLHAPVTPSQRDRRQRKQIMNKETDTTAIMLYSLKEEAGHQRPKDKSTNKKKQKKLRDNTHPLSPTHNLRYPEMNQPPQAISSHPSLIITIQWTQNSWYK